jgi:hypothetical protein
MNTLARAVTFSAVIASAPLGLSGQSADSAALSDSAVRVAVDFGRQAKKTTDVGYKYSIKQMAIGGAGMWGETIDVMARGPQARIAAAASEAAHRYAVFTPDSVTPALRALLIEIVAQPQPPFGVAAQPVGSVRHIVLQTTDRQATAQPIQVDTLVQTWTGGGTIQRLQGLRTLFRATDLPPGEFEIVVILNDERQLRQKVDAKARDRLLGRR